MADALMELFDFTISRQAVAEHLKNADWNVRAQLEKMWQHKSYVMRAVLETKPKVGGSNYPKHDPKKRKF